MDISNAGITLLKQLEGWWRNVYLDSAGLPTIGCGHLLTRSERSSGKLIIDRLATVTYGAGITDEQIEQLLESDLQRPIQAIAVGISVTLSQNQFDALCCFIFNVGVGAFMGSTLRTLLNRGLYSQVPDQMMRWVRAHNGGVVPGLVNRRQAEIALWGAKC